MDGRPNGRNKGAFIKFSSFVWTAYPIADSRFYTEQTNNRQTP